MCELALCVRLVGTDNKSGDLSADEQAGRQKYADLALETLREAVSAGFDDAQKLREQPVPIRDLSAFQEIMKEVASKSE